MSKKSSRTEAMKMMMMDEPSVSVRSQKIVTFADRMKLYDDYYVDSEEDDEDHTV